jgi:hypothetical protein
MNAVPRGSAFTVGIFISSHQARGHPSSITMQRRGGPKQMDGNQHENPELPILNSI